MRELAGALHRTRIADDSRRLVEPLVALYEFAEHDSALAAFRRAYAANPGHVDVGREYAGQCFILGEADEGVRVSRELHARFPDDIGLHSNLALALLIGGDLAKLSKLHAPRMSATSPTPSRKTCSSTVAT